MVLNDTLNNSSTVVLGSTSFGLIIEVLCLWMFFGNLVIILVLTLYKPLTIPDILVFSLALSDLMNVAFPVQVLNIVPNLLHKTWTKPLCIALTWTTYCFRVSSVLTITVISLDRLIAVHKPLFYRSRVIHEIVKVKILMVTLWLVSSFLATLPLIGFGHSGYHSGKCDYQLIHLGFEYGILMEIIGWLQLVIVLYCYINIKVSTSNFMKRQRKFRKGHLQKRVSFKDQESSVKDTENCMQSSKNTLSVGYSSYETHQLRPVRSWRWRGKKKADNDDSLTNGMRQVAKMEKLMAALVFLFYISWLPFLVSNLVSLVIGKTNETVIRIVGLCSLINALANPIIYATIYPRYRKGYLFIFKTILSFCGGQKPEITTADFDSSKRNRSKRLETLREVLSTSSLNSEDNNYTKALRSRTHSSLQQADTIPEEEHNEVKNSIMHIDHNITKRDSEDVSHPRSELNTDRAQMEQEITLPGDSLPFGKYVSVRPENRDDKLIEDETNNTISDLKNGDNMTKKASINNKDIVFLGSGSENKGFEQF